jgi:hypothetical protein
VSGRRTVRVVDGFFDRLDELLPGDRGSQGEPSATDFLLHEMPTVIDRLAEDFEGSTLSVAGRDDLRVLITAGVLVPFIAVYAVLVDEGIEVVYLELEGFHS